MIRYSDIRYYGYQYQSKILINCFPRSHSSPTPPMPSRGTSLYRNSSLPASPRPTAPGQSLGAVAARSGSGAKEMILMWVQNRIRDYPVCNAVYWVQPAS